MSALSMEVSYIPKHSAINIPEILIREPFFRLGSLYATNYGMLGVLIAEEFVHAMDYIGSQYDENGHINKKWWSKQVKDNYVDRAHCFVSQYSVRESKTRMYVNGGQTVANNIADNGALSLAYDAFKLKSNSSKVENFKSSPDWSPDKIFFLAFGQNFCEITDKATMIQKIKFGNHAPAKFRTEIPVYNYDKFYETFKCPKKTKTCKLF